MHRSADTFVVWISGNQRQKLLPPDNSTLENRNREFVNKKSGIYNTTFVTALFDEMSQTYGTVNSISSFGFCYFWREQCADLIEYSDGQVIVDLMSGIAELCVTINKRNQNLSFKSIDLSPSMSKLANTSVKRNKLKSCIVLQQDALDTQFPPNLVDVVVSTFGLKTFSQGQTKQLDRV